MQSPPEVPRIVPSNLFAKLMPLVMIVAVVGMIALMVTVGGRDLTRNPTFLIFPMMMVMSVATGALGVFAHVGQVAEEVLARGLRHLVVVIDDGSVTGSERLTTDAGLDKSRTVLGVPDAYHLRSIPGSAFLKCDADQPVRFNASYVSGDYVKPRPFSRTGRTARA